VPLPQNTKLVFPKVAMGAETELPSTIWSYKQQGYVYANTSAHYTCLVDVLPGPPPPPPVDKSNCSLTPWNACWTGCPNTPKNFTDSGACAGGKVWPIPLNPEGTHGASCNQCACNNDHTSCGGDTAAGHPCVAGWYPDPLLDVEPDTGVPLVPTGMTQAIYIEVCIPYGATAGNYTGAVAMSSDGGGDAVQIPVKLEVWSIDLPKLNDSGAFNTAFNFNSDMRAWYPPGTTPEQQWKDWMPFLGARDQHTSKPNWLS
jgi:hypothetical protein